MRDSTLRHISSWEGLENFITFATTYNDVVWLDIASTMLFVHRSYNILDKNIVKYVCSIKPDIHTQKICGVYNAMSKLGYI